MSRVIGSLGLLEEYRFYVREDWDGPGEGRRPTPVLSRIRFYPGTDTVHPEGTLDLTGGILDLQAALGVDLPDGDGILDGRVLDAGDAVDEVLFNHPDDDDGLAAGSTAMWSDPASQLLFVRLSLVPRRRARTAASTASCWGRSKTMTTPTPPISRSSTPAPTPRSASVTSRPWWS